MFSGILWPIFVAEFFAKIDHFLPMELKLLIWCQFWRLITGRVVQELSNGFYELVLSIIVCELQGEKYRNIKNRQKLTSRDLWWPQIWPEVKNFGCILHDLTRASRWYLHFFRATSGSWISWGGSQLPPGRARLSQTPDRARVKAPGKKMSFDTNINICREQIQG